ncbi:hypothetical protein BDW75DRAFT_240078 [Aspergillus navahoensis]
MAGKRKAVVAYKGSNYKATPTPRKRCCQKHTVDIRHTDPFCYLNFDCASQILEYLDPVSVVRCERVSTGWRGFIRLWICALGLRMQFPDAWNPELKEDKSMSVKIYKGQAAPFATFPAGKASAVRKIWAHVRLFTVAGDFAAWYDGRHIRWQDLSFREDGSFHRIQKLNLELREDEKLSRLQSLHLNEDGCLLIRAVPMLGIYKDFLVDLQTEEIRWRREEIATIVMDPIGDRQALRPVALGADMVYYVSDRAIVGLDIRSGVQLYETPLPNANWENPGHVEAFGRKFLSGNHSALVKLAGREVFVGIIPVDSLWRRSSILLIMDGQRGELLQQTPFTTQDRTTLMVSPDQRQFAVVGTTPDFKALVIRKFAPAPDGRSFMQHLQLVDHPTKAFSSLISTPGAVDPFRSVVALMDKYHKPGVAALIQREGPVGKTMRAHVETYGTKGNVLFKGMHREVTLPPTHYGGPRRSFPSSGRVYSRNDILYVHLVDGHRVVIETMHRVPRPAWSEALTQRHIVTEYVVLDFKLRPGEEHTDDEEDAEHTTPESSPDNGMGFLFL